jgi:hypothetical protein
MKPFSRETIVDRRQPQMRWGAVFAGAVLSLGFWILLQTLGTGLGMSAIDTNDASSVRNAGIGTGIWSIIAPLIAVFLGGMAAGRLAGTREGRVGALHGAIQWALTSILGAYVMASIIMALASGAVQVGGAAVQAGASVGGAVVDKVGGDDLLAPINQKLRSEGKPEIRADQVRAAVRATAQQGLRDGRLDRDVLAQELAKNTGLERADIDELTGQIEARLPQVKQGVNQVGEQAKTAALTAADKTGKGLFMAGIAMLLGLAAAAGGGALGARMSARRDFDGREPRPPVVPATTVTPVTPGSTVTTVSPTHTTVIDPDRDV